MTVKEIKKQIEKLADEIDNYLGKLEQNNKDKGVKYETLLYIAGALRELIDIEID